MGGKRLHSGGVGYVVEIMWFNGLLMINVSSPIYSGVDTCPVFVSDRSSELEKSSDL